jgi:hypothetical protein
MSVKRTERSAGDGKALFHTGGGGRCLEGTLADGKDDL